MSDTAGTAIAVLAALGAAGSFGVAAALQHRQAQLAPRAAGPSLRLLARLAGRPLWLAGIALAAVAYGLQALALAFGPLALVAPIVATDLLFALPVAARWSRRLGPREWLGCALAAGGVAAFLAVAPPSSGGSDAPPQDWLLAFGGVALLCGLAVAVGRPASPGAGNVRAALTALAAGAVFGLTAAVTLSLTRLLRTAGPGATLAHWQPWALLALGAVGLLLSAGAFQAGPLAASLPVMDTVEPVSGVLLGTLLFGERLAVSPMGIAVQLAGAAAAVAGITLLGRYPGTTAPRHAAEHAGPVAGPAMRAADNRSRPVAGVTVGAVGDRPGAAAVPGRAADRSRPGAGPRPGAGRRRTWAAR
jgi:drug/metabolite transporter (DMT)-like permease